VAAAVVGGGGAVGALARAGLAEVWPHQPDEWPWSTLLTNATGAALLGVLLVVLAHRHPRDRYARPLLGTGLLGGYTTFSTWTLETHRQAEDGRGRGALLNLAVSLVLGLACAWAGRRLGMAL
jgi:fluoride exporter